MSAYQLLKKYDVPTPRYTSYPTVPSWDVSSFSIEEWIACVRKVFDESNAEKGISLYVHLPFCESLCTYCACNTRITKNHNVEVPYLHAIINEWTEYKKIFKEKPIVRELHLGGGTPTFFSPANLQSLISGLLTDVIVHPDFQFSFEGHPNNTTRDHLETLFKLGFTRVSFGVQDLNEQVQHAINRIQPFENLEGVVSDAREIGYRSISFDLIYGLPFQTPASIKQTIEEIVTLRPDRIAFYSYAHVPWLKPGQRGYEDADLPTDSAKRTLYEMGKFVLNKSDYEDIGMDHFALPYDDLFKAHASGDLHRNFMGYTTANTDLLIGLGTSAISDAKYAYAQNEKKVEDYLHNIKDSGAAVFKGHILSVEDVLIRRSILSIACQGRLNLELLQQVITPEIHHKLVEMETERLVHFSADGMVVTRSGRAFIRNICNVFDVRSAQLKGQQVYSKAI